MSFYHQCSFFVKKWALAGIVIIIVLGYNNIGYRLLKGIVQ